MKYKSSNSFDYEVKDILTLIEEVDSLFAPPLSDRVDLRSYAKKIDKLASLELAYNEQAELVGMVAFYNNDLETKRAYITFLGVLPEFQKQGIARQLIKKCITNCRKKNMEQIGVETWEDNGPVIKLYKQFDFQIKSVKKDRKNINSVKLLKKL